MGESTWHKNENFQSKVFLQKSKVSSQDSASFWFCFLSLSKKQTLVTKHLLSCKPGVSWSKERGCENQRGNVFLTAVHLHQLPAKPPEIFPSTVTGLACAPGVQTTSCPLALWEYLFVSPGQLAATPGLLLLLPLLPVLKQDSSCKGRCESLSRHEEAVIKTYVTVNNCSHWPYKRLLHRQPQYHTVSWGKTSANTWALSRCHTHPHIYTQTDKYTSN